MAGLLSLIQLLGGAGQLPQLPPMPGPISGFGGGTFNMDGSVATPVQRPDMTPDPNRVSAPVVPDAGPSTAVPASAAPRMTRKRGGVLGALESVFMPEPDSLWASALRNGIWDAKAGQQQYRMGQDKAVLDAQTQAATTRKTNAEATRLERQGNYTVVGNNVLDNNTGAFLPVPTTPSENERLIDRWTKTAPGAERDLIERAIRGYQYTPEAVNVKADAAIRSGTAVAAARGAQARMTKRTPGASSGGRSGKASAKLPTGFILNP